jgi:PTH1 family peptidyl-tRNA hydrolase
MAHAGTGDFGRVRIGIGRPPPGFRGEVADFVLSSFDAVERASLDDCLKLAAESVLEVASRGLEAAMNVRNTRPNKPGKAKPKGAREGGGEAGSVPSAPPEAGEKPEG